MSGSQGCWAQSLDAWHPTRASFGLLWPRTYICAVKAHLHSLYLKNVLSSLKILLNYTYIYKVKISADSCQCMAKTTTILKKERERKKKISARVVEILEDQNENSLVHFGIFPEV